MQHVKNRLNLISPGKQNVNEHKHDSEMIITQFLLALIGKGDMFLMNATKRHHLDVAAALMHCSENVFVRNATC